MNLDKKLELAQKFAEIMLEVDYSQCGSSSQDIAVNAWKHADAMEDEYNKRKQEEDKSNAESSRIMFEKLTKNKDGSCKHLHTTFGGGNCFDCGEVLKNV